MNKYQLAAFGGETALSEKDNYQWPLITALEEQAVINQMSESMSIYNRSGVIEKFEEKFKKIHNQKYALLNNSGTNALQALYVGAQLKPNDEVICPVYTFFATNTPLLSTGVKIVFADCDQNGNLDPVDVKRKITEKTKAVIVTHMWGYPANMKGIINAIKGKGIYLFEDCSHAHLAEYCGQKVGSFGDGAVWSLQGQKNITGGEGGILTTNHNEIYYRAILLGHYNKRAKDEIPQDHLLYKYAVTGMGLKHRSHPLAIAFALCQLDNHYQTQRFRDHYAEGYKKVFGGKKYFELLNDKQAKPSWYAFIVKVKKSSPLSRDDIYQLILSEGLAEVDVPNSTCPNNALPIFQQPHGLYSNQYGTNEAFNSHDDFPGADEFHSTILKLPVWARSYENFKHYINGLNKVVNYVESH